MIRCETPLKMFFDGHKLNGSWQTIIQPFDTLFMYRKTNSFESWKPWRNVATKDVILKNPNFDTLDEFVLIPCGECSSCKLKRSDEKVIQLLAEAVSRDFKDIWHLTLSFDDYHLIENDMYIGDNFYMKPIPLRESEWKRASKWTIDPRVVESFDGEIPTEPLWSDEYNMYIDPKDYDHFGEIEEPLFTVDPRIKWTLNRRPYQLFLKRLRKALISRYGKDAYEEMDLMYFGCGEYGDNPNGTIRPHFHIIFFGLPIHDLEPYPRVEYNIDGTPKEAYKSDWIDSLWGNNNPKVLPTQITKFNGATARYVARYVQKKNRGRSSYSYKETFNPKNPNEKFYVIEHPGLGYFRDTNRLEPFTVSSHNRPFGINWLKSKYPKFPFKYNSLPLPNCHDSNGNIYNAYMTRSWSDYLKNHHDDFGLTKEAFKEWKDKGHEALINSTKAYLKQYKEISNGKPLLTDIFDKANKANKAISVLPPRKDF